MTPAGTTHYVYDLDGHLIAEATDTGTTVREYVWFDDMPLAVVADVDTSTPHLYYVHSDHLNRPLKMTDDTKTVVWDAVYKPFGEVVSITGAASNNLRFPGQYFLIEAGLHYNWYRHYDPMLGRYVQPDPIGFAGGPNIYSYVIGNPISFADPKGRNPFTAIIGGAEVGGAVAGPFGAVVGEVIAGVIGSVIIYNMARSRGKSDPVSGSVPTNPGRDCNGNYKPCPPPEIWSAEGDAHGSKGGTHYHGIVWNQDLDSCECFPKRVSGPDPGNLK